jgi:HSP20 family protein
MPNRGLTPRNGSRDLSGYPRDPFSIFRREMDQLFDNFLAPVDARSGQSALQTAWPSVDVHENDAAYTVTVEVPGLDPKEVEVNLRDNMLIVSGEKRQEQTSEDGGRTWTERTYGRFERVVPLETEVDADKIEATHHNGVLKIALPKNAEARNKTRKIAIKSN